MQQRLVHRSDDTEEAMVKRIEQYKKNVDAIKVGHSHGLVVHATAALDSMTPSWEERPMYVDFVGWFQDYYKDITMEFDGVGDKMKLADKIADFIKVRFSAHLGHRVHGM